MGSKFKHTCRLYIVMLKQAPASPSTSVVMKTFNKKEKKISKNLKLTSVQSALTNTKNCVKN